MPRRLLSSILRSWSLGALVASAALAQQPAGSAAEQQRLQQLATQGRAVQQTAANQAFLVSYFRRAVSLYLHRHDNLSCRALFGMGDEPQLLAAVGSPGGREVNRFFIEGDESPKHDDDGDYIFPTNSWEKYWPATPRLNTYWHEAQHTLMYPAGVAVDPAPYRPILDDAKEKDEHHVLIEAIGQRGSEAYAFLLPFEEAVRRADRLESRWIAEGRDPSDYAWQRQAWGEAHQLFSEFLKAMLRLPVVPDASLAAYRASTGIWFSSAERVAEFYRAGGLKRLEQGEATSIRPPSWVFWPDLHVMPVQVMVQDANGRDLEEAGALAKAPSVAKDDAFRQTVVLSVRARGSKSRMTGSSIRDLKVAGTVARGVLRIRIVEEEPLTGLAMTQGKAATADAAIAPGGPSTRFFVINLDAVEAQPVRLTFVRRKLSLLKQPTTYHVTFQFSDSGTARLYDPAAAQLSFTLGAGAAGAGKAAATGVGTASGPATTATSAAPPATGPVANRNPLGVKMLWGTIPDGFTAKTGNPDSQTLPSAVISSPGEIELVNGATSYFGRGVYQAGSLSSNRVEVFGRQLDQNLVTLQDYVTYSAGKSDPREFRSYRHAETTVSGLRAFESILGETSRMQHFHHYMVELDPQRHLYVLILGYMNIRNRSTEMDVLKAEHASIIRGLRFSVAAGPPLALTKSEPLPLPKALSDEPIEDNEIQKRPPPSAESGGGGGRRRSGAPTTTSTGATTSSTPGSGAPSTGATSGVTPGASSPGASSSGVGGAGTGGTSTAGTGSTTPAATGGPAPGAPAATAANSEGVLNGRGSLGLNGGAPMVSLANESRVHWTRCTVTAPGRRVYVIGTLPAGTGRDYPLKAFKTDASAPSLTTSALLQCLEGRLPVAINLKSVSPDSLAAALNKASKGLEENAKKLKKAFGGLFKKP